MTETISLSTASVLAFGFVLGLKHAVEVDHLAAVSTIVSERKSLLSSLLVGGLWGVGHTFSLLIAGFFVILLHVEISERVALFLEFCVGLMLVVLGANALRKLWRGGHFHIHAHSHGGRAHVHPHIHDREAETDNHTHHGYQSSMRPLFVGMVHGLAGSAALMLLVLSTISSPLVGFAYIIIFGVGSIGGMMMMSALVSLPLYLTATRFTRANLMMRGLAGLFSLSFGLFVIYQIGVAGNLFR
jgi:MFS family permease